MFQYALTLLLTLLPFAFAAPIEAQGHGDAWKYGTGGGVIGFIVLILDIIVFRKSCCPHCCLAGTKNTTSRGPPVQPPSTKQGAVVPPRIPLPHRWHDYLLAVLQPCRAQ